MARNSEFGRRIKQLRQGLGFSKSKLAGLCGVTTTAVWNWEENGIVPRSEAFALLAKALGKSETFLRVGQDNASPPPSTSGRTVAVIIEDARNEISDITGVPINSVHLNVEFVSH